jgi:hypothetical protein
MPLSRQDRKFAWTCVRDDSCSSARVTFAASSEPGVVDGVAVSS